MILLSLIWPFATSVEAQTSTQILLLDSFTTQSGATGGQLVNAMKVKDQSGSADNPKNYVLFTTPGIIYKGTQIFKVPEQDSNASVTTMELRVNYKGPSNSVQKWSWSIYNAKNDSWTTLGSNTNSKSNIWTLFKFQVRNPSSYFTPDGDIRIKFMSNNSNGDAKIDYVAMSITLQVPDPSTANSATPTSGSTSIPTIPETTVPASETPALVSATPTLLPVSTLSPTDTIVVPSSVTSDPGTSMPGSFPSPTQGIPPATSVPSFTPSNTPTLLPASTDTLVPTLTTTFLPTYTPTLQPTFTATSLPTDKPTAAFTMSPTQKPPATIYYVANNGNDSNPGSLTLPFATISKAMYVVQSGDTIVVRGGIYPDFYTNKSNITISGYNGEMPVISGGIGIRCFQQTNVVIQGFEVTKTTAGNYVGAIMLDQCNNSVIQNNKIHDNLNTYVSGISINDSSNNKIMNNESYNNSYVGINISGASLNNEVAFNKAHNNNLAAGDADGITISDSLVTNTNIHDNMVFDNSDDGIDTWISAGNTITNNTSYGNGGTGDGNGFKLGGAGAGGNNTALGNISYSNMTCGFTSNGSGDYYANNTAYNNGSCGFDDSWRENGNTQTSSYINNLAYNNPAGNFLKNSIYTTVFNGNSEVPR